MSIGAVADATDIPAATLRTWERRYGFPAPERTDAGHRRYRPEVVDRLRLTARALDAGHRPSDVVGLSVDSLNDLLADSDDGREGGGSSEADSWLDEAFAAVNDLDIDRLEQLLRTGWDRSGALAFVVEYAAPLLRRIGDGWTAELLSIADEHIASHKLRQFLGNQWRPLTRGASGPTILLTTPENELHSGGLHMAAVVFALAGWRIIFLGANTPTENIVETAHNAEPAAVGVSIAESYDPALARETLEAIRDGLPAGTDLLTGGAGAPDDVEGVPKIDDLRVLYDWAVERV